MIRRIIKGLSKEDYTAKQAEKDRLDKDCFYNDSIQNLKGSVDDIRGHVEDLRGALGSSISHLSALVTDLEALVNNVNHECKARIGDFSLQLDACKARFTSDKDKLENLTDKFDGLSAKYDHLERQPGIIRKLINEVKTEWNGHLVSQGQVFDHKLTAMKEDILATPTGIEELKMHVDNAVEFININGRSAVARAEINEKHIHLLDKKVEQIFLIFKRNKIEG